VEHYTAKGITCKEKFCCNPSRIWYAGFVDVVAHPGHAIEYWLMAPVGKNRARLQVCFSGTVQGVGFRYTACNIARRFQVTGFVKNLSDGQVELVAEGDKLEVFNFVAAIEEDMRGYIVRSEKTISEPTNEFPSFKIAF